MALPTLEQPLVCASLDAFHPAKGSVGNLGGPVRSLEPSDLVFAGRAASSSFYDLHVVVFCFVVIL